MDTIVTKSVTKNTGAQQLFSPLRGVRSRGHGWGDLVPPLQGCNFCNFLACFSTFPKSSFFVRIGFSIFLVHLVHFIPSAPYVRIYQMHQMHQMYQMCQMHQMYQMYQMYQCTKCTNVLNVPMYQMYQKVWYRND